VIGGGQNVSERKKRSDVGAAFGARSTAAGEEGVVRCGRLEGHTL